jgi:hypothetical protein
MDESREMEGFKGLAETLTRSLEAHVALRPYVTNQPPELAPCSLSVGLLDLLGLLVSWAANCDCTGRRVVHVSRS